MSDSRKDVDRMSAPEPRQEDAETGHGRLPSGVESSTPVGQQWSRRRFGKAALGATPIIATLYGRPLWAAANCTPSGWISGNTSNHHALEDCQGDTPEYWQGPASKSQHAGWNNTYDEALNSQYGFSGLSFYVGGESATLQQAVEAPAQTPFDGVDGLTRQLMRFGTAALLNARYVIDYSLTEGQVTEMVGMAVEYGHYTTPGGDELTALQVKNFLENTMGLDEASWGG